MKASLTALLLAHEMKKNWKSAAKLQTIEVVI